MLPSFHGLESEDPYRHLDEFLDICATMKISHIEDDALRQRLFPLSLKESKTLAQVSTSFDEDCYMGGTSEGVPEEVFFHRQDEPFQTCDHYIFSFRGRDFPSGVGAHEEVAAEVSTPSDCKEAGSSGVLRRADGSASTDDRFILWRLFDAE
ncbi:unnamed protein product [Victoria cruziana]